MEIQEWLRSTTAGEIMTRDVVTLSPDDSLGTAVESLLDATVSGAPVVDARNRCVGVLSLSDVARAEEAEIDARWEVVHSDFFNSPLALPTHVLADRLETLRDRLVPASDHRVAEFMTTNLVTVPESGDLDGIVRAMVDAHVHRVIVVGANETMCGVISTTDVLAALMHTSVMADVAEESMR